KLKKLKVDEATATKIFRFYLEEAPYDLWPALPTLDDALVPVFLRELDAHKRQKNTLEAKLLRAVSAREFHAMAALIAFSASGSNVPALLKRADRSKDEFDTPGVLAATTQVLLAL